MSCKEDLKTGKQQKYRRLQCISDTKYECMKYRQTNYSVLILSDWQYAAPRVAIKPTPQTESLILSKKTEDLTNDVCVLETQTVSITY